MIPLELAQERIDRDVHRLAPETVETANASGLIVAEEVRSDVQIPPFVSVAMDGFAVVASDTVGASEDNPVELTVVETVAAGSVAQAKMASGEAIRIMTGAPLPDGADAVVMVELTEMAAAGSDGRERVRVSAEVPYWNNLRDAGSAVAEGDVMVTAGTLIGPAHVGLLSSVGVAKLSVFRRPRVGVLSTGDELVHPSESLGPGEIYDSNRPMLLALVAASGCTPVDLGHCPDDEAQIEQIYRTGAETCDALISSGGVSMGDFDPVKAVLGRLAEMSWMQIAIKPAKPLSFGLVANTPVFGLPGNPVSAAVSFELFARPNLRKMAGDLRPHRRMVSAISDEVLGRRADGKVHFVRVVVSHQIDGALHVRSAGAQQSHQLGALAAANGLAVLADGVTVQEGGRVSVLLTDRSVFSSSVPVA